MNTRATLVDLLDRVLNRGLVLSADVIISVAGVPLLAVNLRAALAGVETMLQHGLMADWDAAQRLAAAAARRSRAPGSPLENGETARLRDFASVWRQRGIYAAWRPGRLVLTDRRLRLDRQSPAETLLDLPLAELLDVQLTEEDGPAGLPVPVLLLRTAHGDERLRTAHPDRWLAALRPLHRETVVTP